MNTNKLFFMSFLLIQSIFVGSIQASDISNKVIYPGIQLTVLNGKKYISSIGGDQTLRPLPKNGESLKLSADILIETINNNLWITASKKCGLIETVKIKV